VQTVTLENGRATVTITGLNRGVHLLTTRYGGTDQLGSSRSLPSLVFSL